MKTFTLFIIILFSNSIVTLSQIIHVHKKNGQVDYYDMRLVSRIKYIPPVSDSGGIPCPGISTIDYEGKTYKTALIGNQCWLKENLNVGTRIESNSLDNGIIEKYCYDNIEAKCDTFGGLYVWDEVMQYTYSEGTRGICPEGWHIPTRKEFETLAEEVGDKINATRWSGSNALKRIGLGQGNGIGTNESGFSAFFAGVRYPKSNYGELKQATYFWSSTEDNSKWSWYIDFNKGSDEISFTNYEKSAGFSLRCLKD